MLEQMPPDTVLTSLTFKARNFLIGSVQATLSYNYSSPVFEKAGIGYQTSQTLNFTADRPVRRIFGNDDKGTKSHISRVDFIDQNGNYIASFNPYND